MGKIVDGHTHLRQRHALDREETQAAELIEGIPESNIEIAVQHILQRCIQIWTSMTHLIAICIWVGGVHLSQSTATHCVTSWQRYTGGGMGSNKLDAAYAADEALNHSLS